MDKIQLVRELATRLNVTQNEARTHLDEFLNIVTTEILVGGYVRIANFGVFERLERKPYNARNPHTGEPVAVPATFMPKFRPSNNLKKYVNS